MAMIEKGVIFMNENEKIETMDDIAPEMEE
jgi:hypothetical protein